MDWLRRNWPDLAIGIALIAVIAGIVATLITGGSFFPIGGGGGSTPPTPTPPSAVVTTPSTPSTPVIGEPPAAGVEGGVEQPLGEPLSTEPSLTEPLAGEPLAGEPVVGEPVDPAPAAADPDPSPVAQPPVVVVTPVAPDPQPAATPDPAPQAQPQAPAVVVTPTPAVDPAPAATPAPAGALPAASADEEAPFRVSAGAFGNADNAARLAQTLRDAGYPVFTGTQGNLTIVLVGPYETEAAADQVSARIAAGGFGVQPAVYRFRPDAAESNAAVSTPATPAEPAAATPAPATPAPVTPAPVTPAPAVGSNEPIATSSTGRSLQVGAFVDLASTQPLRDRLAGLGLVAFEVREGGLVKLLVGPFDDANLALARARLAQQGIESFPR